MDELQIAPSVEATNGEPADAAEAVDTDTSGGAH